MGVGAPIRVSTSAFDKPVGALLGAGLSLRAVWTRVPVRHSLTRSNVIYRTYPTLSNPIQMRSARLQASFVAATLVVAACVEAPTTIQLQPTANPHLVPLASPELERLVLCKAGPVGTYTFSAVASEPNVLWNTGTSAYDLSNTSYSITVNAGSTIDVGGNVVQGACATFSFNAASHNHIGLASGSVDAQATIVETVIPAGAVFDHVVTYQNVGGTVTSTSSTTNSATGRFGGNGTGPSGLTGAVVVFYNVPANSGNSITLQTVKVLPTRSGGYVTDFSGSFEVKAFDQPVTVVALSFKVSKNGEKAFWQGTCTTSPAVSFNVNKSSTVLVTIPPSCVIANSPSFKSGDDVRLEVIATLATGRVFSNSGFYKIP